MQKLIDFTLVYSSCIFLLQYVVSIFIGFIISRIIQILHGKDEYGIVIYSRHVSMLLLSLFSGFILALMVLIVDCGGVITITI